MGLRRNYTSDLIEHQKLLEITRNYRLQERDARIITTLATSGMMSTWQIWRLEFPCPIPGHFLYCDCPVTVPVTRRLKFLRENIHAIQCYKVPPEWSPRIGAFHTPDPDFQKLCISYDGTLTDEQMAKLYDYVKERHKVLVSTIASPRGGLLHHAFVIDCFIWFALSEHRSRYAYPSLEIEYVLERNEMKMWNETDAIPDAIFRMSVDGRLWTLYIEADRGTEFSKEIEAKFQRFRKLLSIENSVVLFITHRKKLLTQMRYEAAGKSEIADKIWFSSYDKNYLDSVRANALLDPIWVKFDDSNADKKSSAFSLLTGLFSREGLVM